MLKEFANYLIRQWTDPIEIHPDLATDEERADPFHETTPWHWYQHSGRPEWEQWMKGSDATWSMRVPRQSRETIWWCHSLHEAALHYSWSLASPTFDQLAQLLKLAMEIGDNEIVGLVCLRIFKWGGLKDHPSTSWVEHHAARGTLIARISEAVELLQPKSTWGNHSSQRFSRPGDQQDLTPEALDYLPMDSAMTKVYAAADTNGKVMIYDGRMGAGLCLLLRSFVMEQRLAGKLLSPKMPPELDFLWGPGRGDKDDRRNPTIRGTFEVSRLGSATNSERRAEVSWRANYLAELVTDPLKETALKFERALFMIGYDIRRMPYSDYRRLR